MYDLKDPFEMADDSSAVLENKQRYENTIKTFGTAEMFLEAEKTGNWYKLIDSNNGGLSGIVYNFSCGAIWPDGTVASLDDFAMNTATLKTLLSMRWRQVAIMRKSEVEKKYGIIVLDDIRK